MGVMLTVFVLMLMWCLVGVSALFLGLFNQFRGLKCGESSWLCSPLVPFMFGVDNLGVVRHVGRLIDGCRGPALLSLSMMVISSC